MIPVTSPFTVVQTIGNGANRLIHGECLRIMRALQDESFDTLYLDPPFFTGQERRLRRDDDHGPTYADVWENGLTEYLGWLEVRLGEMRRLLKPEGALFLHLDWHAVHYAKVLLDRLFGPAHFQNELIWYYSGGGAARRRFARKHDTILYYTKSATAWKFYADRVREPYKWTAGQPRADGSPRDLARGKLPDDVWRHHALLPWAGESLGYPTQKPLALLTRLLLATTDEGDLVGDFFCGSGTTAAAAHALGRRWVTTDLSRVAVCLAAERLAELLDPGCVAHAARRARARAADRHARIIADPDRLGLDAPTLARLAPTLFPRAGFTVECCKGAGAAEGRECSSP